MTFPSARRIALPIAAALAVCASLVPAWGARVPGESWIGIFLNGRKIGYSDTRVDRSMYGGKPAYRVVSHTITRLEVLGNRVSQDILLTAYTDRQYVPLRQEYVISSNGSRIDLRADFRPGKVVCALRSGAGTARPDTRVLTIPPGAKIISDSSDSTMGKALPAGRKATYYYLNPLTIALEKMDLAVLGRETVTLAGRAYDATRVSATTPFGTFISWVAPDGDLLKGEGPLGMTMVRQPRDAALNMASAIPSFEVANAGGSVRQLYKPPADFAIATAIATDKPIEKPREAADLTLTVSGIDDKRLILSDSRQRAEPSTDAAFTLHVTAARFDVQESAKLPITDSSAALYLRRAPYLEIDDPRIMRVATTLRGGETNAYKVAMAVRSWVHKTMHPDYSIGVPRSCTDVLKRPRGVCRDYATLYAGVARAAGVPTRVVGGIVYAEGRFFYHAWDEVWVGRWVPVDATMPGEFVDATHVKFSQGDVTDMFNISGVVGRIKLRVDSVG